MRGGLVAGLLPTLYFGPKSTGRRICTELDAMIVGSQKVQQKYKDYLRFKPVPYGKQEMKNFLVNYNHHALICTLGRLIGQIVDYTAYQKRTEKEKAAYAVAIAKEIADEMLKPLAIAGGFFDCSQVCGEFNCITSINPIVKIPSADFLERVIRSLENPPTSAL